MLEETGRTHAEGSESGTKDWTEQWRFGIDILGRCNCLDDLSNDTTVMNPVSLLLL